MYKRQYLQIPGPTNIPEPVLNPLNHSAINHRGGEFAELLKNNVAGLKEVFQTKNDIVIFPSSGSGALEATVVNMLSPGDQVLGTNIGVFSQRFALVARNFGASVTIIDKAWGTAATPEDIREALAKDQNHQYKAVLITHNETATGVTSDVAGIRRVMDQLGHPALLLVDAVSSLAITDLPTDELRIDVVVSASQKGLMLPGGLGLAAISPKAWSAQRQAKMPKWYWDFMAMKQRMEVGQMPYTPAISLLFGLKVALGLLEEEGLDHVFHRHRRNGDAVRAGIKALGLELLVKNQGEQSNAVTAVRLPAGISCADLQQATENYGVVIGGGLQQLQGKIFRVGHLGMLHEAEVIAVLGILEMTLRQLGHKVQPGAAVAAASDVYLS